MSAAVRLVPEAADDEFNTLIDFGVLAESATCPEAIACFTDPSFHRLLTITCWSELSSAGVPVRSRFLNASPIVKGAEVCVVEDVNVKDVTAEPVGGEVVPACVAASRIAE